MFCRELYMDEYCVKHFRSIKKKLKNRTVQPGIYVIVLSKESGRVEYMHNAFLCQKYYKDNSPFVLGLAHSQDVILEMIQTMLEETFDARGDYDIRAYFREKMEKISYKKLKMYRFTIIGNEKKESKT